MAYEYANEFCKQCQTNLRKTRKLSVNHKHFSYRKTCMPMLFFFETGIQDVYIGTTTTDIHSQWIEG